MKNEDILYTYIDKINMSTELTSKTCVGTKFRRSDITNWYGFANIPTAKDTRCEYCFRHIKDLGVNSDDAMYEFVSRRSFINCNSMTDPFLTMIEVDGFRFQITNQDGDIPFLIYPPLSASRREGLLVIEMPEKTKYSIVIDPQIKERNIENIAYYSFEITVGGKPVVINNGNPTYYRDISTIHGFDRNTGFEFTATDPTALMESLPKNLINITVKCYARLDDRFVKVHHITAGIQLIYVNPDKYQVPNHRNIFNNLT